MGGCDKGEIDLLILRFSIMVKELKSVERSRSGFGKATGGNIIVFLQILPVPSVLKLRVSLCY